MPKKVVTRRQRKAAEAKRQSETNARNMPDRITTKAADATKAAPTVAKPSCCAVKSVPKVSRNVNPTKSEKSGELKETVEEISEGKTKVKILVKDKPTELEKKTCDLKADVEIVHNTSNSPQRSMPPPVLPNEQGSFSKSLTRRAVATFTKIQKLSKVLNKKMNYKGSQAKVDDPNNLSEAQLDETMKNALNGPSGSNNPANKPCNCEFCKVVLNQLMAGKKRSSDKKTCKKSTRRLPNRLRSMSVGCKINQKDQRGEEKFEECTAQPPSVANSRKRIIEMLEKKEKLLEKNVIRKMKQLHNQKSDVTMKEQRIQSEPQNHKLKTPIAQINANEQKTKPCKGDSSKRDGVSRRICFLESSRKARGQTSNVKSAMPKIQNFIHVNLPGQMETLPVELADAPSVQAIGNTGYFTLSGTDEQLITQLDNLAKKNIIIWNCAELEPGVNDQVEHQLKELMANKDIILQRMKDKHEVMAARRPRRTREPSKYT